MRHFIHTDEFPRADLERMLDRAAAFKRGEGGTPLKGKSVALLFFNPSLRTRVSMEVGVAQLGGTTTTLEVGAGVWTLEHREGVVMDADRTEHIRDAAKVLSRYVDAIAVRSFPKFEDRVADAQDVVIESFRRHAEVPVLNMESALWHPMQAMADALTVREKLGAIEGKKIALTWVWHPKSVPACVSNSFVTCLARLGAKVTVAHPPEFPLDERVAKCATIVHDPRAIEGAQVLYAKSWASPAVYEDKKADAALRDRYRDWRVEDTRGAWFMHCLPVRRNVEVTDAVIDGPTSAVYDQAENRLHTQKAILSEIVR